MKRDKSITCYVISYQQQKVMNPSYSVVTIVSDDEIRPI